MQALQLSAFSELEARELCDQTGDLGLWDETRCSADAATRPPVCRGLTWTKWAEQTRLFLENNPLLRRESAQVLVGTALHLHQHGVLISWFSLFRVPEWAMFEQYLPSFHWCCWVLMVAMSGSTASHSSFQVSYHYIHPLLQIAFCKQYVSALSVVLSYQHNKRKAWALWALGGHRTKQLRESIQSSYIFYPHNDNFPL